MKLYDNWMKAFENRDFDEVMKFYHPDFSFVRHQTNTVINLLEWSLLMKSNLESNKLKCYHQNVVMKTMIF